ncbi:GNAT family N-acetyltransferase [Aestuariirhabdus sp. Z084]|uniref:GNAT family N-acetyltransferase n=1 Tax=Aestuariirhabdus haliotis TaxID=2918751 RepID=UPI00201B3902|nr:GNAT family N-acetyltransferase [Aestuariirhabdus haliotis]MCL6414813.1 GNAT family N-acetyltransferase [Aestuariirhabdus haliotis]MCL6418745.1 GNAT family N-acetyltransferase [Aestuariirhabdus haliotis]
MQSNEIDPQPLNTQIVPLDHNWKREARSLLFHAYRECPIYQRLFSSELEGFSQRLRSGIREMCNIYFSAEDPVLGIMANERLAGVAVLSSPNSKRLADILSWRWKMMLTAGFGCTDRVREYQGRVADHLMDCYQVPLIGVSAQQRHHGLGKLLLDEIHKRVESDSNARGVVIDTANPAFLPYYEELGYQVIDTLAVDGFEEKVLMRPNPVRLVQ